MPAHHGSESFFVEGEGLIGTQLGGRHGNAPDPLTESEEPTAAAPQQLAAGEAPPFRFSRCGPKGDALGPAVIKRLAIAMVEGGGGQGDVPAGYTYLGQFVDHDLTFDRTDVALGEDVTPAELCRAGIATCGVELVQVFAREEELALGGGAVDIEGEIEPGNPVHPDVTVFNRVRMRFQLEGVTRDEAEHLVTRFKGR